jgi:hypothetical protein
MDLISSVIGMAFVIAFRVAITVLGIWVAVKWGII